ncbi:mevalonate kinase [Methanohalobium sp.]|uniref:mevalonate kinase n=1 Tax=Methanohalobium sp. TaxID=2837493 RepID=UPI0025F0390A|nr:mevalonate kinase [Methanohalobium sp.]
MITSSAPGKIYLFGEHAVVYGENAICCAIELRTYVQAEFCDRIEINSVLGRSGLNFEKHPYVSAVIERMKKFVPVDGVKININSELPVGSGLGSSAALTVSTIQALNHLFHCGLSLEQIAELGYSVEREVQGNASPTDTYVSTMGGVFMLPSRRKLELDHCGIVIGDTKKNSSTKKLVTNVAELKNRFPEIVTSILSTIGKITYCGEYSVCNGDYESIGKLMNINQGLLDSVGVGSLELSQLIYSARSKGAYGAKLTGAGGGGCMVALTDTSKTVDVSDSIKSAGGVPITTNITDKGVVVETKR